MKILKFIFIAVFFVSLSACVGGGSAKSSIDDDTRVMDEFTVPASGNVTYTGSGDFEGFNLTVNNTGLAGRTIYVEKIEPAYTIDGYTALSDIYAVRLTDSASDIGDEVYSASITTPYNTAILANAGGAGGDVKVCSVSSGTVTKYTTTPGSGSYVSSSVVFPGRFFSGFTDSAELNEASGNILFKGISYADAADTITDPSGTAHPDVVRGIRFIQPGEKAVLGINEEAFDDEVLTYLWSISSKPAGSSSTLTAVDDDVILIPDTAGIYYIELTLNGVNGYTETETLGVVAQNYSYSTSANDAVCFDSCHDGSINSDANDQYGREILRDLVSPWIGSAHASAFTSVAAETDSTCFKCHTTGFLFADRDSDDTDEYASANGYDDTIANWAAPAGGDDHLKGVTCEACHAPGTGAAGTFAQKHYSDTPITSDVCLSCHANGTVAGHSFEYSTVHDNAHTLAGGNVARNVACFECHTGQGALSNFYDADIAPADTGGVSGVGCAVCHDPHDENGYNASLRLSGDYNFPTSSGSRTADAGDSRACYECHSTDYVLPAVGSVPHNSQAEMAEGLGGYTYGTVISDRKSIHTDLGVGCIDCHMVKQSGSTHDFLMANGSADRIAACDDTCHSFISSPVFEDGHYDYEGKISAVRAKIDQLKETINEKAGLPLSTAVKADYSAGTLCA